MIFTDNYIEMMEEEKVKKRRGRRPLTEAERSARQEPCLICGDSSTGFHYGVRSCEGCKGFFKRSIQMKRNYECHSRNNCNILKGTRNACQACRMRKCFDSGMQAGLVRFDRTPGNRPKKISIGMAEEISGSDEKGEAFECYAPRKIVNCCESGPISSTSFIDHHLSGNKTPFRRVISSVAHSTGSSYNYPEDEVIRPGSSISYNPKSTLSGMPCYLTNGHTSLPPPPPPPLPGKVESPQPLALNMYSTSSIPNVPHYSEQVNNSHTSTNRNPLSVFYEMNREGFPYSGREANHCTNGNNDNHFTNQLMASTNSDHFNVSFSDGSSRFGNSRTVNQRVTSHPKKSALAKTLSWDASDRQNNYKSVTLLENNVQNQMKGESYLGENFSMLPESCRNCSSPKLPDSSSHGAFPADSTSFENDLCSHNLVSSTTVLEGVNGFDEDCYGVSGLGPEEYSWSNLSPFFSNDIFPTNNVNNPDQPSQEHNKVKGAFSDTNLHSGSQIEPTSIHSPVYEMDKTPLPPSNSLSQLSSNNISTSNNNSSNNITNNYSPGIHRQCVVNTDETKDAPLFKKIRCSINTFLSNSPLSTGLPTDTSFPQSKAAVDPSCLTFTLAVQRAEPNYLPTYKAKCSHLTSQEYMDATFEEVEQIVMFARKIPGFMDLSLPDRKMLVSQSFIGVQLIRLVFRSQMQEEDHYLFSDNHIIKSDTLLAISGFPVLAVKYLKELVKWFHFLRIDEMECGLFQVLLLVIDVLDDLQDRDAVYSLQKRALSSLTAYSIARFPNDSQRIHTLLLRMPAIQRFGTLCRDSFLQRVEMGILHPNALSVELLFVGQKYNKSGMKESPNAVNNNESATNGSLLSLYLGPLEDRKTQHHCSNKFSAFSTKV